MTSTPEAADVVAKRRELLAALSTPKTKPELVETLASSRSTVDRAIRSLEDQQLVEQNGSRYTTTFAGEEALAAYEYFLDRLDALLRAQPVLDDLKGRVDVDPKILHGADVVEATRAIPGKPLDDTIPLFEGAETFKGTGPAVVPRYIDVLLTMADEGASVELVVTESVLDALQTEYADRFESMTAATSFSLYVTAEPMSTGIWSAEQPSTTVSGLIVYGHTGVSGVVNNDSEAMNEWANARYESYRDGAQRFD